MEEKDLLKLAFELGVLSRTPRTGPYHVGITNHETSAAHSFRTTALAYFISQEEGADTGKVLRMCLVHDFPETRLLNQTFIQEEFNPLKGKLSEVLSRQLRGLPGSEELSAAFEEMTQGRTLEARIARDASTLEALVEAKEYLQQGLEVMEAWFSGKEKSLSTESAKRLLKVLEKETIKWWKDE